MAERPIIFSTKMVRALLTCARCGKLSRAFPCNCGSTDFSKTQTRRLIKPPPYQVGDKLWVREKLVVEIDDLQATKAFFAADSQPTGFSWEWKKDFLPSIFMPKYLAWIWLEVTRVRVERVQDITTEDAIAEGIDENAWEVKVDLFKNLWNSLHGKSAWEKNEPVFVYEFKRIK